MLIISVEILKTMEKMAEKCKGARGTEAIVKGWELNDFVVHLS